MPRLSDDTQKVSLRAVVAISHNDGHEASGCVAGKNMPAQAELALDFFSRRTAFVSTSFSYDRGITMMMNISREKRPAQ